MTDIVVRKFGCGNAVHPKVKKILAQANFHINLSVCHLPSFLIEVGFEMFNEIFHKIFGNVINFKQIVQMYIMYVSYKTNSFYPMAI